MSNQKFLVSTREIIALIVAVGTTVASLAFGYGIQNNRVEELSKVVDRDRQIVVQLSDRILQLDRSVTELSAVIRLMNEEKKK